MPGSASRVGGIGAAPDYGEVVSKSFLLAHKRGCICGLLVRFFHRVYSNIKQETLTSGTSAGGDSGGPYYTQGSAGGNNYNFLGVHWGSNTDSGGSNIWFTPYVRFKSYFTVKTS